MSTQLLAWLAARCAYDFGETADFAWRGEGVLSAAAAPKSSALFLAGSSVCLFSVCYFLLQVSDYVAPTAQ
jgi:hypothetical protein